MVEQAKPRRPSTFERSLQHQNHSKNNTHILGDAMAVQKQNDQRVVNHVCPKTQHKWDKLIIVIK